MRECMFHGKLHYFHQWFVKQYPVGKLAGINGHGEGQVSELYAVLEDEYGCVKLVNYNQFKFIDGIKLNRCMSETELIERILTNGN